MRSLLDTEEEEETTAREITLSTASLLGIFFGLVLICGVFFGFGYSMGRGTEQGAQAASLGTGPAGSAAQSDETTTAANQPPEAPPARSQDNASAPAKAAPPVIVRHAKPDDAEDASAEDAAPQPPKHVSQALVAATESAPALKPSARIAAAPPIVASTPAPVAVPAPGTGKPMVQIAAVARQEDADVLVSALRQRGYGVVVRSEPQDKLLHVQVGPFADRTQAAAIKQKLLSDGYNAIIKQ
jgi:cell division septation protein DedD